MSEPIQGYIRADVPLRVLETAVQMSTIDPLTGFLEISTEDGVLRLAMSGDVAKDLRIDLDQFLAEERNS